MDERRAAVDDTVFRSFAISSSSPTVVGLCCDDQAELDLMLDELDLIASRTRPERADR
jgi:hypothetical protein